MHGRGDGQAAGDQPRGNICVRRLPDAQGRDTWERQPRGARGRGTGPRNRSRDRSSSRSGSAGRAVGPGHGLGQFMENSERAGEAEDAGDGTGEGRDGESTAQQERGLLLLMQPLESDHGGDGAPPERINAR